MDFDKSKMQIVAMVSVMTEKPTLIKPSTVRVPKNLSSTAILNRRFNVILCYNKASDHEESGWLVAGWMKETLGKALSEQPMLTGRLKWRSEDPTARDLQVFVNDSGARLVEANLDMKLDDFLAVKGKRPEAEAELVFWDDVDEHDPRFSPLFYVQVTNFSCGSYSIGISCSLLLADPFSLTSFIKRWACLHNTALPKLKGAEVPLFYIPNLGKQITSFNRVAISSNTYRTAAQSVFFKIPTKISNLEDRTHNNLALICINEAEHEIGREMASKFSLFVKIPREDVKAEICPRDDGLLEKPPKVNIGRLSYAEILEELELNKTRFNQGNELANASCWINSVVDEGSVIIVSSDVVKPSGMSHIIVSFS